MKHAVMVLNAGSSSLKFAMYPLDPTLAATPRLFGQVEGIGAAPVLHATDTRTGEHIDRSFPHCEDDNDEHEHALEEVLSWLYEHSPNLEIVAAGHRIVHGGDHYAAPALLGPDALADLEKLIPLAPLHQPHNLDPIRALFTLRPEMRQIGCFDTAFHHTRLPEASRFGLPREMFDAGIKRYGFHGLSYEYIARKLPDVVGEARARGPVIVAHLGNGASMCALREGCSRDTSMGFTAVDGLMMGTRTGSLDPGVLLHLIEEREMDSKALTKLLYKQSGLLGVSGISQDMRTLLESDAPEAAEAVDLFCYRAAGMIGQLAMAAGGLDTLVFTGGIGEHAAPVRERICRWLAWSGLQLDADANSANAELIHHPDSRSHVLVIPTNEEWMIARHVVEVMGLED
jgi:acetate kinase